MLDATELARRLVEAMDKAQPKVTSAAVAKACDVTPQAVNGWRTTGRVAKRHLSKIAELTKQPLEYFLEAEPRAIRSHGMTLAIEEAQAVKRLRSALPDWRRYVLGLAMVDSEEAQRLLLTTMRQAVPDYKVEQALETSRHGFPPGEHELARVRNGTEQPSSGRDDKATRRRIKDS